MKSELEMTCLEEDIKIRLWELELGGATHHVSGLPDFDVSRDIRLVPPFNGKDVDKYYTMFERVATSLKWPREVWTLLLQY